MLLKATIRFHDQELNITQRNLQDIKRAVNGIFLRDLPAFRLNVVEIEICESFRNLGHIIYNTFDDRYNVNREIHVILYFSGAITI